MGELSRRMNVETVSNVTVVQLTDRKILDEVSISQIGTGSRYEVKFTSDGTVSAGSGTVHVLGGERYGRISVFGAGGTQVERWNGSRWELGT